MRRADKAGSQFVVVLGGNELQSKTAVLKNMRGGASKEVSLDVDHILGALGGVTSPTA